MAVTDSKSVSQSDLLSYQQAPKPTQMFVHQLQPKTAPLNSFQGSDFGRVKQ